jgi:hypothetical protein
MDTSIVPALAGLTGAAIGGLTSGIASWFAQKTQSRVQLLAQDKLPRQERNAMPTRSNTKNRTFPH